MSVIESLDEAASNSTLTNNSCILEPAKDSLLLNQGLGDHPAGTGTVSRWASLR